MEIFRHGSYFYAFDMQPDESREVFLNRVQFIINASTNSEINFEDLVQLSLLWRNVTFYNMIYPSRVMKRLRLLQSKN